MEHNVKESIGFTCGCFNTDFIGILSITFVSIYLFTYYF